MMPIAHLVEFMYKLCEPYGMKVPQLTPSRIRLLSCNRTFNCSKAKDRLGYTPIVSLQVAIFSQVSCCNNLSNATFCLIFCGLDFDIFAGGYRENNRVILTFEG